MADIKIKEGSLSIDIVGAVAHKVGDPINVILLVDTPTHSNSPSAGTKFHMGSWRVMTPAEMNAVHQATPKQQAPAKP